MARNQVVMPGFAAFHVGIQTDAAPTDETSDTVLSRDEDADGDYVDDGMSEEE